MKFGDAITAMADQNYIAYRDGWNGKGMFIFLQQGRTFETSAMRIWGEEQMPSAALNRMQDLATVKFLPRLCMFTATKEVVVGWLASQTDILSDDWHIEKLK